MAELPVLTSSRLILRPFTLDDAPTVQRLAGTREVTSTTLSIPYPYPDGLAEEWIESHKMRFEQEVGIHLAIERAKERDLIGAIGFLDLDRAHQRAELGYWIGHPYWGNGYATEAGRAIVKYGFETLGLQRIYAYHFAGNAASGRVLEKIGMKREGVRRQHTLKDSVFLDSVAYGILRSEF